MIKEVLGLAPEIDKTAFVAETAAVIGDVHLAADTSVWFGAVVRADLAAIYIGEGSNVQDNCTLHVDEGFPVRLGRGVTVGHNAVVHGCVVGDDVIIGMNSTILNGAVIGDGCIIGANALVTAGAVIPPRSVVVGVPAKVKKPVDDATLQRIRANAKSYSDAAKAYARKPGVVPV